MGITGYDMNEKELSTLTGIVADPENNVYSLLSRKNRENLSEIIRIFKLTAKERYSHKMFAIRKLATFRLVMSNN